MAKAPTAPLIAFGAIAVAPAWSLLLDQDDKPHHSWRRLSILNMLDVRIEGSFDGTNVHFYIEDGSRSTWDFNYVNTWSVYVRAVSAPSSGDVTAEALS